MMKRKYEALYIHPDFCDGFYDNEEERYLKPEEVNELLNYKLKPNEIEDILNRDCEVEIEEKSSMSELGLVFEGLGLAILGLANVVWALIRIISCIAIAGYISIRFGLEGYLWWFSTIIIFCILSKIVFFGYNKNNYGELVENYNIKAKEYNDE